ncbi:5'-methylthioadenosine/S-adenosylhomocysteine nucleosidase [Archangium gephyra]|nr:5'-methylthioadenosine/S-adenosylhomocysteine nucleosidase [Archangium gephyra]
MTAVERVRRFEAMTSPLARQLVRLFAAAPLSLPVMRLIWQTMLPEARHGHFAEVMLSGLIRQATPEQAGELEEATLDFVEGVREVLLESVPSSQTWEILRATSRYTQRNIGKTLDFPALLANPEMLGEEVDERLRPFAQVAASVLRQLGGYDELVARLEGAPSQRTRIAGITPHVTPAEEAPEENKQPIPVASIPTATWRWSGKWVAVVGYHREAIDLGPFRSSEDYQQLLKLGHRLGQMLAREGHGLVSKERSSVDVAVEQAFAQEFRRLGGDPSAVLQQLIKGHPLFMRRGTREIKQLPFEADAVVLLGGPLGRDIDVWSLYTGAGVMNFSLREPWTTAADAHVSNNWKGVLESLDVSLEVDASITAVTFVRLRDLIKQAPNRIAPYAKALLLLIASEEVELADSNPWQTDLLWELVREAGLPLPVDDGGTGFFKMLLEAELEPELPLLQHELRLRANQVAHLRLLGCLPAMRDRLSEDVSRMGDLGELGRRLQARLRVLLFESGGGAEVEEAGNGKVPPKQSRVTEKRSEQLVKALLSAFPIGTELAKFVGFRLRRGPSFSAGEPLQRQVRHLVEQAEQEGWIEELVDAARRARPGNPLLKAIRTLRAVILTVLAAESQAVRAHLTELREGAHPEGTIYERGRFFSQEQTWDVIIAEVMPHDDLEVERILQFFEPTVVLSIGIAAGIKDVAIGDVVVANRVYSFDSGKVENTLGALPDADVAASSFDLVQRALDEALREDWLARIGESSETGPRVFVAPIVTAMSVLTASNLDAIDVLKERYHDVLALDVEGFGMWNAVQSYPSVSVLVIRGISDLMDRDKDDGAQQEAARNAAAFAFELLAKY